MIFGKLDLLCVLLSTDSVCLKGGIGFALFAHPRLGLLGKKSANTWQCL